MAMLSHRQGWSFAVLLLFPCVFFASSASDSPNTVFRSSTSEVRVSFFATDEKNSPVAQVGADDFAVVDNGIVVRTFRSLQRSGENELSLTLLIDTSKSIQARFEEIQEVVERVISDPSAGLIPEQISIITFGGLKPAVLCVADCLSAVSRQRFQAIKSAGTTPLFDTLTFSSRFVAHKHSSNARQIFLLFSDGNDNVSITSAPEAMDSVIAAGAVLYAINLESANSRSSENLSLQQLAEATGGRSLSLEPGTFNAVTAILADLRASYVVTYQLPNRMTGFHSLRILPKHNLNLRFHCRKGYFYDENQ
jgi:VWFA-related protein